MRRGLFRNWFATLAGKFPNRSLSMTKRQPAKNDDSMIGVLQARAVSQKSLHGKKYRYWTAWLRARTRKQTPQKPLKAVLSCTSSNGFGQIGSKTKRGFQNSYKPFLPFQKDFFWKTPKIGLSIFTITIWKMWRLNWCFSVFILKSNFLNSLKRSPWRKCKTSTRNRWFYFPDNYDIYDRLCEVPACGIIHILHI